MKLFNRFQRDPAFQIEDREAMSRALTKLGNAAVRTQAEYEHITVKESPVPTAAEIDAVRRNEGEILRPDASE